MGRCSAPIGPDNPCAAHRTDHLLLTVSVARVASTVEEGENAQFTVTRTGVTAGALTVRYRVSETGAMVASGDEGAQSVDFSGNAARVTVTVPTVDDSTHEADSTVTLTLTADATHDLGTDDTATVTVENDDNAAPTIDVTKRGCTRRCGAMSAPTVSGWGRRAWGELLSRSSFQLSLGGEGEAGGSGAGALVLWGRGSRSWSAGRMDPEVTTRGEALSGQLGVELRVREDALLGVMLSGSAGEVEFDGARDAEVETELVGVHPYAQWSPRRGLRTWAMLGYGAGEATLMDGFSARTGAAIETDIEMRMAAAGGATRWRRCGVSTGRWERAGSSCSSMRTDRGSCCRRWSRRCGRCGCCWKAVRGRTSSGSRG